MAIPTHLDNLTLYHSLSSVNLTKKQNASLLICISLTVTKVDISLVVHEVEVYIYSIGLLVIFQINSAFLHRNYFWRKTIIK